MTPTHWPEGQVLGNNDLESQNSFAWSQDYPGLRYIISAAEVDSNYWTNATLDPIDHSTNGYSQSNEFKWYAITSYVNEHPRNDAWSPLVMQAQERSAERDLEVENSQATIGEDNEEESGLNSP